MTLSARLNAHADRYMVPTAKDYKRWATEAAALENMVMDLIGWNPNPFPPEVIAQARALVGIKVKS